MPFRFATAILMTLLAIASLPQAGAPQESRLSYHIQATVGANQIDGTTTVTVPISQVHDGMVLVDPNSAGSLNDTARLSIVSVVGEDGQPVSGARGSDGLLRYQIVPPAGGSAVNLRVRFSVRLAPGDLNQLGYHLFPAREAGTRWYPEVVGPGGIPPRFADFDVTLDWPDSMAVITTGARQARAASNTRRRARFRAHHVEGFALGVAPEHERAVLERGGVTVEILAPPALLDAYRNVGERALDAAAFYKRLYGFFPNERLGIVPGPEGYWGGFPMPGLFMIHRGNLTADFIRFITAHELGHYYWGLHVLDDGERLGWLMLANGILADQIYLADYHGRSLEEQWRTRREGDWMEHFLQAHVAGWEQRLGLDRTTARSLHFDYNSLVRHGKGATGLYLQVRRVGVEDFVAFQRDLLRDFRYRPLPLATFIDRLEDAGATGAHDFFERWVRDDASIAYDVANIDTMADGTARVIEIRQTGTVPYPIEVAVEDGHEVLRRKTISTAVSQDTIVIRGSGDWRIRLDPDGAVPMWNSDHPAIQRLFIHALYDAGVTLPFIVLARDYLTAHDDPAMRRRLETALELNGG